MRKQLLFCLFVLLPTLLRGQVDTRTLKIDSLKRELANAKTDTAKVLIYEKMSGVAPNSPAQLEFARQGLALARRIHYDKGIILCGNEYAFRLIEVDYYRAIPILMESKQLCERSNNQFELVRVLGFLGYAYDKFDFQKGLFYYRQCKNLMKKAGITEDVIPINSAIGNAYKDHGSPDSALVYLQKGYQWALKSPVLLKPNGFLRNFGEVYYKKGQPDSAITYFRRSIATTAGKFDGQNYEGIARIYRDRNQLDSARFYAKEALNSQQEQNRTMYIITAANLLFDLYKTSNPAEALKYHLIASAAKDTLFNQEKARQVEKLAFDDQERESRTQRRIKAHELDLQNQVRFYSVLGILGLVVFVAFVLYRNNRQKQRANKLLEQQKLEIQAQRDQTAQTLHQLRDTQTQLIQAEKMASLGELTAGIAHEIQNPLNFVNNFSEVSAELVAELEEEQQKPDRDPELEAELLGDLKQNLQKITLHGGRASNIVKGMLEHSRTASGEREPTDLNALADEYLRLAYQGLRAKDKGFNCRLVTEPDPDLGQVDVVPQEIGRVLLNLYNNAFYAVQQRQQGGGAEYQPSVRVSTRRTETGVEIRVSDNGTGIPDAVRAKIFQPFFTTKPTGEGTGLGLSLSYDIVTKGHGGTLTVESKEGEGTEFIITLPVRTL